MKNNEQNAVEIMKRGGAVLASEWTTGHGKYISRRATPIFCKEIETSKICLLKGFAKDSANRLFKKHPLAKKMIVVNDVRAVRKLMKWKKYL